MQVVRSSSSRPTPAIKIASRAWLAIWSKDPELKQSKTEIKRRIAAAVDTSKKRSAFRRDSNLSPFKDNMYISLDSG